MFGIFRTCFLAIVLLSGFCSLLYQVLWDRLARHNFGGDNTSASIVIAVFLLGLGIGAFVFRNARRNHLLVYGIVEISIGLFALISYEYINNISFYLAAFLQPTADELSGVRAVTVLGCILFILPPCILMGGTLPLMFGGFFARAPFTPKEVGLLYGLNVSGALFGAFAVPYLLLNTVAIPTALEIAATLNIAIGLAAIVFHYAVEERHFDRTSEPERRLPVVPGALWITFVTGAATSVIEIVYIRHAFNLLPGSPYNFAFVIGAVLLSLSAGSVCLPALRTVSSDPRKSIAIFMLAATAGLLLSIGAANYISTAFLAPDLQHVGTTMLYFLLIIFPIFFLWAPFSPFFVPPPVLRRLP